MVGEIGDCDCAVIAKGSLAAKTTLFVGSYYEYKIVETLTSTVATTRTYYLVGSTRVAMRDNGTLIFLLSDHLGSTSLTTDASGGVLSVQKYMPYGEPRGTGGLDTDYTFTGQRTAAAGLMYYNARHYDPALSHFIEADPIILTAKLWVKSHLCNLTHKVAALATLCFQVAEVNYHPLKQVVVD